MSDEWITKQNDTKYLEANLKDADGYMDLTNAMGVVFNMRDTAGNVKVSRAVCTIQDAGTGLVRWAPDAADTDTFGTYRGEFEVTYADGRVETHPADDYIPIRIRDDIA